MCPTTLRSSHTVYATAVSRTTMAIRLLITDAMMNCSKLSTKFSCHTCSVTPVPRRCHSSEPLRPFLDLLLQETFQSAATSSGDCLFSITEFKVREYLPSVPD